MLQFLASSSKNVTEQASIPRLPVFQTSHMKDVNTLLRAAVLPLEQLHSTDHTMLNCSVTRSKIRAKVTDGRDFGAIRGSGAERI